MRVVASLHLATSSHISAASHDTDGSSDPDRPLYRRLQTKERVTGFSSVKILFHMLKMWPEPFNRFEKCVAMLTFLHQASR